MRLVKYNQIGMCAAFASTCMAATIGTVAINPGSAPAGNAASVTITAQIPDPSVITSSVNLQRIDAQGRVVEVVGSMVDDGANGDAVSGDRVFTIRFTVLQQTPGTLTYRASAGLLGSLTPIFSRPVTFNSTGNVATGITITQPANLIFVGITPITISGTVGDPGAVVRINAISANKSGKSFQVSIPLQEGNNTITAVAANTNGSDSTASIQVTLDTTPPHVTVDSPSAEFKTTESSISVSGIVNDLVVGTVNNQQATVLVNGIPAQVSNRHYVAASVALSVGENTIQVVGKDQTGNSATVNVKVTREVAGPQIIKLVSGNNQSGPVGAPLPSALLVQLLKGGAPVPNAPVIFKVTENDAFLQPGPARQQLIVVNTNAQGQAQATLTLGHRAGAGNNTVQAYAVGFQGVAVFNASGTPKQAARIYMDSGSSQFGAIAQALALPLVTVVTDDGHNRLANVPVTFTVKQGGGNIGGQAKIQTTTDGDGRALAVLTLGSQPGRDSNIVEATIAGNQGPPATFTASSKAPGDPAQTSISGLVLDNSNNPIPGVTMRLFQTNQANSNNQPVQLGTPVPTDAKGFFKLTSAPMGFFKLMADGTTATQTGKSFPTLEYDIVTVAGQDNGVGTPIYLPALDPQAEICVSATTGGELKLASSPGFSLKVQPGSATFPGGNKSGCIRRPLKTGALARNALILRDKAGIQPGFSAHKHWCWSGSFVRVTENRH